MIKINFIHIPKNGGTSFSELCNNYSEYFVYNGHDVDVYDKNIQNQLVIVQNPISRFKSAVRYCFIDLWINNPQIKYLYDNNLTTPNIWVDILKNEYHLEHSNLMKEMLNVGHYVGNKRLKYKWTYAQQTNYINNPKYVILMENLEEETNILLNKLGLQFKLNKLNSTEKTLENDYISPENIYWLQNHFYKEDCEMYTKYKNIPVEERLHL
jgi:hypothetical protein